MSLITSIKNRYQGLRTKNPDSPLYRLHPELADRIHLTSSPHAASVDFGSYEALAKIYKSYTWVKRAISVKANAIAPLPIQVRDADNEIIENHPISNLFSHVNDTDSPSTLQNAYVVDMDLAGEFFIEINEAGGEPAEFWRRDPGEVNVHADISRPRFPIAAGYTLGDDKEIIPPERMIHIKYFNPLLPLRGLGNIAAVRNGIVIDTFAQSWSKLFFQRSARPDYALIAPQGITKTEKETLENMLVTKFGGLDNSHRPIVLEEKITDIKTFSHPPKDIEWLDQRKMARDEVGAIFGVPDEIMGFGHNTYDNFETAYFVLWLLTLKPMIEFRDSSLTNYFTKTRKLLGDGEKVVTDISGVNALQEDLTQKLEQAEKLFAMGYPLNQINERLNLGMAEVSWGEIGYLPGNLLPVNAQPNGNGNGKYFVLPHQPAGLLTKQEPDEINEPAEVGKYEQAISDLVEAANVGEIDRDGFEEQLEELVIASLLALFLIGLGLDSADELTLEELNALAEETTLAVDSIGNLADDTYAGKFAEGEGGEPPEHNLAARVAIWSGFAASVFWLGVLHARDNEFLAWAYNPLKDNCSDCLRLNGQVHRRKDWLNSGWWPKGRNLECTGRRCGCGFRKSQGPASGRF